MSGATTESPPVSITFYSSTNNPTYEQNVTLTWNITNSANQSINEGIGSVGANGSLDISSPAAAAADGRSAQRTYQLSVLGLDGLTSSSNLTVYWSASVGYGYVNCPWTSPWDSYFCTWGRL